MRDTNIEKGKREMMPTVESLAQEYTSTFGYPFDDVSSARMRDFLHWATQRGIVEIKEVPSYYQFGGVSLWFTDAQFAFIINAVVSDRKIVAIKAAREYSRKNTTFPGVEGDLGLKSTKDWVDHLSLILQQARVTEQISITPQF